MKAISPVRSMASCYQAVCCLSEQSLSIARSSSHKGSEEPMGLLYDMNDCYSKLRELVPGIPQGSKLSQVEILQHVIDYIFDLQIVLGEEQEHNSILSFQKSDFSELSTKGDANSICH
ncbi:DNA-binding protein inhibitor ID-3 [Ranitomeya imitator]|uniref:DNA-binding protein inhibitor ID-3 n=1 Tax=Ranitomeya imitator TaxID=111125 RepID=UPI001AAC1206